MIVVELPIRTVSEPNVRDPRWRKTRRTRELRGVTQLAMRARVRGVAFPVVVTLTRLSSGTLDDDNLRGALKAVRDGVADALGLRDDSDPRVVFGYLQERAARGLHAVRIVVDSAAAQSSSASDANDSTSKSSA